MRATSSSLLPKSLTASVLVVSKYRLWSRKRSRDPFSAGVWIASCSWAEYKISPRWKSQPLKFKPANFSNQLLSKVSKVSSSRSILQFALLAFKLRAVKFALLQMKICSFKQQSNYPKPKSNIRRATMSQEKPIWANIIGFCLPMFGFDSLSLNTYEISLF